MKQGMSDDLLQTGVNRAALGWMGFAEAIRISVGRRKKMTNACRPWRG